MKQSLASWSGRFRSPAYWLAVGFGAGLVRPAPGTWGSAAAVLIGWGFHEAGVNTAALIGIIVITSVFGSIAIDKIESTCGVHDAPEIVIDEFAGQWIVLLPLFYGMVSVEKVFVAFFLFRIFDIWKPYPIGWLDKKVSGGFGVMVDDLVAGLYALICFELIYYFIT